MPFIGQVEDVNDPKGAYRVKVRCIGVHPCDKQGEEGVKTEDLPWARVGMPTTHAQQARIGAKHGLLPGSYVFGYFLDGEDCQDPMILCSLTATSKSVDKDDREMPQSKDGTFQDQETCFGKFIVSPATQPNATLRTKGEKSQGFGNEADPSGDTINNDGDYDAGNQCGGKKANQAEKNRIMQEEKSSDFTPEGGRSGRRSLWS